MKRVSSHMLREGLRGATARPGMPAADTFWSEFRERARLYPQQEAESRDARAAWAWPALRWAAAACIAIALTWAGLSFTGTAQAGPSTISSVEVVASYGGVVIMEDEPSQATILWIVDMDAGGGGGDAI